MGRATIWPPPSVKPWTDHLQNLYRWLRLDTYHCAKFYPNRIRGFVSAHARLRASNSYSAIFWVLNPAHTKTPPRTLTQNTSKDTVSRKDVPFRGSTYTTFPLKLPFSGPISTLLNPPIPKLFRQPRQPKRGSNRPPPPIVAFFCLVQVVGVNVA